MLDASSLTFLRTREPARVSLQTLRSPYNEVDVVVVEVVISEDAPIRGLLSILTYS